MNQTLIQTFYEAFSRRDAARMASCYHPEAYFRDEAFELHSGAEIGDMWLMLCINGKDLRIEFRDIKASDNAQKTSSGEAVGSAHWEAYYTFSATKRPVHNIIEARFKFKDGKIIEHIDSFNFWQWSRQSLGIMGWLLGWTPFLKNKVRQTAMASLKKFRTGR